MPGSNNRCILFAAFHRRRGPTRSDRQARNLTYRFFDSPIGEEIRRHDLGTGSETGRPLRRLIEQSSVRFGQMSPQHATALRQVAFRVSRCRPECGRAHDRVRQDAFEALRFSLSIRLQSSFGLVFRHRVSRCDTRIIALLRQLRTGLSRSSNRSLLHCRMWRREKNFRRQRPHRQRPQNSGKKYNQRPKIGYTTRESL